ncbi:hypothetical protein C8R44DRAFT_923357 [Mycena epipterygia]|nr:hypothetical protein C8R44DRAFT_923357 [Mycena epipterygia]
MALFALCNCKHYPCISRGTACLFFSFPALYSFLSTITSQVAVALGGSRFPGALAGMLVEILPFLQGVASNIRSVLGDDHPGLVPTVMAAYALTSFLTGAAFVILGLLKLGNFVRMSCFSHLSLLAASFFPAFILSITLRSRYIELWTRGLVRSAYYIPLFLLLIPTVFWTAVWSLKVSQEHLIAAGWLFTVESTSSAASVASWNYWTLFNFGLVEWWSLKSAIQNIVLLVVVGVLNLPIYVPTLAFTLDVSYDMNHELLGQGVANILAGVVGTVPNILQYSYSVYFTRAKGGRFELWLVILLTAALFFISGLLLPHVPTILASALVLFLGMELFLEATWEASKTLAWMEYAVVMGTLAACTFLGFAEGFGVGIGAAMVVYLMYGVIDSPARVTWWNEWNELQQVKNQDEDRVAVPVKGRLVSPRNYTPPVITLDAPRASADVDDTDILQHINARVVVLSGYIFFASVPSIEKELLDSKIPAAFFILDLARAHRIETTAARCLPRCARELELRASRLVICGLAMGSGLHADFERAEIPLGFDLQEVEGNRNGIPAFTTREACVAWCEREHEKRAALDNKSEGI